MSKDFTWLSYGVHESGILLFLDNQVMLHIAKNLVFYEHRKHIELDYHFVR